MAKHYATDENRVTFVPLSIKLRQHRTMLIAALADRLNLHPGWVAEILRMTRLAPGIVQAILVGKQPRL